MLKIKAIDHINLFVKNLEESSNFYKKLFNLEEKERRVSGTSQAPFVIIGNPNSFYLCLYENAVEAAKESGAFNHFGVNLENFEAAEKELKEMGIEILYGGIIDFPKSKSIYIKDPDGNEIELSSHFGGNLG